MTDIVLLKKVIKERKCSIAYLARQIGKSQQAIHNKLNGKSEFTVLEARTITSVLGLTPEERDKIFYS